MDLTPEFLVGRTAHLRAKWKLCGRKLADPTLLVQERKWKLRVQIPKIDAALRRIADGSYGGCVVCGEPIPEARLIVRPEATRCLECEQMSEERRRAVAHA